MTDTGAYVGQRAPEIDLPDQNGQRWRLRDHGGQVVVLLFYPGDETPVCTKQLCSVRDNWTRYQAAGAEVVGINTDPVAKHQRFAANHNLPLRLLADADGSVVRAYGMKNLLGTKRGVVVIDAEGFVRYRRTVLPIFRPTDDEVLAAIAEAGGRQQRR
jgi:thioredoxin-dependent peroxiredoxin